MASYLLINFWLSRIQAVKSSLKAFILNRIGDIGIFGAMGILYYSCLSLEFAVLLPMIPFLVNASGFLAMEYLRIICLLFFLGVSGKSAQLGLQT